MEFEELKKEILKRAKQANACTDEYKKAYAAINMESLCNVIKNNFNWCCMNNVITGNLIEAYKALFTENEIYYNVNIDKGHLLASGSATV